MKAGPDSPQESLPLVILSGGTAKAALESKDPIPASAKMNLEGHFYRRWRVSGSIKELDQIYYGKFLFVIGIAIRQGVLRLRSAGASLRSG
jgi:hypothetical protein